MLLKKNISDAFSRAAASYDRYSRIQEGLAQRLIEEIKDLPDARTILEIGCGTGGYTLLIADAFPRASITAVDISGAMLARAAMKLKSRKGIRLIEGDIEDMAGMSGKFQIITSNSAMHWLNRLGETVRQLSRCLTHSGMFAATIFGSQSLLELKKVIEETFGASRELPIDNFPSKRVLEGIMTSTFPDWKIDRLHIKRRYHDMLSLLKTLKGSGVAPGTGHGPLIRTPHSVKALEDCFKRRYGRIEITYEVFICCGRRGPT